MMIEPKLRFKADDGSDFPDWESTTVGELFTFVTEKNESGRISDVITNSAEHGLIPQREYFDKDIAVEGNTEGYTVIHKGDFVYNPRKSTIAPFGPFNIYERDEVGIVSPLYTCLTPRDGETAPYLSWYFKTSRWHRYIVTHGAQGGARHDRVGMTNALMKGIPVMLPSLPEQRKIADLLSAVDDVISAQEAEVAAWEKRKKGVMQKLFSQEVRFKADDGSDFPDWEEKTLGDVGSVAMCKRVFKEQTREVGDVPFFKIGTFGDVPDAYISKSLFDELKSKYAYPKVGTILLSASGTIGRQVEYNGEDAYYQDSNIVWLEHDDTVLDSYLKQFYSVVKWQGLEGSTIKRLYNKTILDTPFYRPSLPEQRKIAECLALLDDVIAKAKDELDAWRELKKGLLQQMFV